MPCPGLPCPAPACPALPRPALPCPALPCCYLATALPLPFYIVRVCSAHTTAPPRSPQTHRAAAEVPAHAGGSHDHPALRARLSGHHMERHCAAQILAKSRGTRLFVFKPVFHVLRPPGSGGGCAPPGPSIYSPLDAIPVGRYARFTPAWKGTMRTASRRANPSLPPLHQVRIGPPGRSTTTPTSRRTNPFPAVLPGT